MTLSFRTAASSVTLNRVPTVKRFVAVTLAVSTLVLGVAGCGGSDDATPPPATETVQEPVALTKTELITQGDGICAEVNAAIGSIEAATTTSETDKAGQVAALYGGLADRLEKLGAPSDGPAPEEMIAALRQLADAGAETADPETFHRAAEEYGFTDCAEAASAPSGDVPGGTTTDPGYEAPAPAPEPAPAPAPAPDTGGVSPTPPATGGASPPADGTGGSTGGSGGGATGGIGPGG